MTTNTSNNVFNIAVRGNFDDCQSWLKSSLVLILKFKNTT